MATLRVPAGRRVTSSLPILIAPSLIGSSPAISRSSVDLPQPDGPTKTANSPSSMASDTSVMASNAP